MVRKSWLMVHAALLLGLILCISLSLQTAEPSHSAAQVQTPGESPTADRSTNLKVFSQALSLVEDQYAKPKTTKVLIYGAIQGALGSLDPHSSFMTPEDLKELQIETKGKFSGIGIEIAMKDQVLIVVSPIEGTPAYQMGLQPGDQIIKINGQPTKNMSLTDAVKAIRGPQGTKVTLTINREGFSKPRDYPITRQIIPIHSVKGRIMEDGIGYIRITSFQDQTDSDLHSFLKKMKQRLVPFRGLVLDLRNDPGGLLEQAVRVSNEFIRSGLIVYTEGRNRQQTGRFYADIDEDKPAANLPMVVLVNGGSASASEIVAGALKDHKRALIVGTKTFGKGSVQTIIPLEDGSALRLTTALYFTPSGITINDKGIVPDVEVPDKPLPANESLEGLRDEYMEKHMLKEGLTDKPWTQPISAAELDKDPQLKRAFEILSNRPPQAAQRS